MRRNSALTCVIVASGLLVLAAAGWHLGVGPAFAGQTNDDVGSGSARGIVAGPGTVIEVGDEWFCDPSYEDGVCQTTINAGDTVNWLWVGGSRHTTTECGGAPKSCPKPHLWDSPKQKSGSFMFTFDSPGTFVYRCQIHPDMRGKIVVLTAPLPPPPENEPPPSDNPPSPPPDTTPPPGDERSPSADPPPDSGSGPIPPVVLSEPSSDPQGTVEGLPDTGGAPHTGGQEAAVGWWLALATGGSLIMAGLVAAARGLSRRP